MHVNTRHSRKPTNEQRTRYWTRETYEKKLKFREVDVFGMCMRKAAWDPSPFTVCDVEVPR